MKLIPKKKKNIFPFRLSLRYKVAFPVLIFLCFIIYLQFRTAYRLVSGMVMERTESRLRAITEVYAETVKVPLILRNQQVLHANIAWMARRADVLEVRVEDPQGVTLGTSRPSPSLLPDDVVRADFLGARSITADAYAVAVPIQVQERTLGRVLILFSNQGFQEELRNIFAERLRFAFIMAVILAFATAGVTWLVLRPLVIFQRTVQSILAGDLTARAHIHSFDEIEDLAAAFNEMVARLSKSLNNLRARTEALEESEEKYRLIVEDSTDVILMLTPQGDLVLLNRGFSGFSRDELLAGGLPKILTLHSEESRKRFSDALLLAQEKEEAVTNVATTHIAQGTQSEIFYLTNLNPVLDHEGHVKLIQVVMRDVTELRRIEMMKESLIRDVAHELKTPTAKFAMAISWFEKEIERKGDVQKYHDIVKILKNNTDRLMRTIISIMDLTKLESGLMQVVSMDLDLREVLDQVRQDMTPLCQEKKIGFEYTPSASSLRITGDRDMLYRLFVNIIGNAIKFTELGKIAMTGTKEANRVRVEIRDTGLGIEPEDLEIIFERFVQKTPSSTGIGVGLTISRQIAALHEGRIWAESEGLGKGAIFTVEFPAI